MTSDFTSMWRKLHAAGIVADDVPEIEPDQLDSDRNLLPAIIASWERAKERSNVSVAPGKSISWLSDQGEVGAGLTIGLPGIPEKTSRKWVGDRLAWWPSGISQFRRIGLVSSRLGRDLDNYDDWFAVLRAACAKVDPAAEVLVTASSTASNRFVRRAAEHFGLTTLTIRTHPNDGTSLKSWFNQLVKQGSDSGQPSHCTIYLSPPLETTSLSNVFEGIQSTPLRDRAVVAASDRLLVFHLKKDGHVDRIVRARLSHSDWPTTSTFIAVGEQLVRRPRAEELLAMGAVGWVVLNTLDKSPAGFHSQSSPESHRIITPPAVREWDFLTHCTRRRTGPWPEQTENEYLDDLILAHAAADHTPLAALNRILTQQRIIASHHIIRGTMAGVSLTAIPLTELLDRRTFRPHRGGWDFEPFGICIKRSWLIERGASPVIYGDDQVWRTLSNAERPFFQMSESRGQQGREPIDWTVEQEWRHVGDIDLGDIPDDAAFVFVPTETDAAKIGHSCRWPIAIVPPHDKQ